MELICAIQNYEWGKKGSSSKVALLNRNVNEDFHVDENLPYAELWMGTHVSGPSKLKGSNELLGSVISNKPELLGEKIVLFDNDLPFLFKVLSIDKALSIQAHPSKDHAEKLHIKFPNVYKDPNHKPELAVALTTFEALCGFRPVKEVRSFFQSIPELRRLINCQEVDDVQFLEETFKAVLTSKREIVVSVIDDLINRMETSNECDRDKCLETLVKRLHSQFPYDNGILMVYFLNYLQLKPSQAIYLGANEPHAYISGDCIEVMACSDNVVRAGLTPKFVDVDTLCSMLTYKGDSPDTKIFKPYAEDVYCSIYKPPVKDFAVAEINIPSTTAEYTTTRRDSASILIVVSGSANSNAVDLKPGRTLFLPSGESLYITDISENLLIYQALANIF